MPIFALDRKTAKLITTTQVITSVYSAVKELVENALDAGADNVEINLVDNGTSLIEVKDNGYGISREDAPYMGLSSYTSKISNFEDLDELQTFGFRGEALGALCAVAEVSIITKTKDDVVGTLYSMNQDGCIANHEPCHRSIVQVKNLFKQVPVRRQMITNTRKANQVVKSLETLMQCFGICKPNVRIQYRVNSNLVFTKPSLNNIKESVTYVLGRKITSNMEWIEPDDAGFPLQLMLPSKTVRNLSEISHPDLHYIFVNDRPIKHKDLEKLVHNLILEYFDQDLYRKKVMFLVYITLEPKDIDVNLEPNKDTIFFKNQNKVFDTIDKCMRKFYGLKSVEITERNLSNDISACYEDYASNTNDADSELSACKKRKLHAREKIHETIPNIIVTEMPNNKDNIITSGFEKCQVEQQSDVRDQQHYTDALVLTTQIQPPNLSDSDSNDMSFVRISSDNRMDEERESISQLPVVDLGEDFDLREIETRVPMINIMNKDTKVNEIQETKQVSLESWSKGHVTGVKSGISIKSDIAVEGQLYTTGSDIKINEEFKRKDELKKAHVDRKDLQFLKHVKSQVAKENPTLTTTQTAKKITEFWKKLSSEERGYYRDIAQEEEKEHQGLEAPEERTVANKTDAEKSKNRLLKLFEKMKNIKNEKKENLNMRTIIPWIFDRTKIITRSDFETEHIVGRLAPTLWIAIIYQQLWIVDITGLIKGLKVTNIDIDKIDAKKIEHLLKQWLMETDDTSVMHSIYEFTKQV
ncbi:PMS1 protein homolog 1-like isoform X2 [Pseudomyrmex gracilis]|uniref:PMS1 protein homolog 1-like isoform X2 n=1 Tax=Pseudomyrmex gracilis TaxID=219809 RepID=UPI000994FB2F|nr:PMS1 protein homolog 1-like isoform X2 [Pseudomyrmex gracilis]